MDDPIQTKEREPLLVEPKDFQPVEFKPINNHLVVLKEQTYLFIIIMMCILRSIMQLFAMIKNDAFSEALIDVYILEIYNPKGHIYSQPHGCYELKQYKEPL